jgi:hypothetical protein
VDWAEHPAAGVFAHSTDSSGRQLLMVRRAGCGLDDYGTVDARQIKRARIDGERCFQLKAWRFGAALWLGNSWLLMESKRAGCGRDGYGTVDARQIKRARIEGE